MFGISFNEILLIMILGVIVFGPEQLPQIAKTLGKMFFALQSTLTKLRQDIYYQTGLSELEEAKHDLNKIYSEVKDTLTSKQTILYTDKTNTMTDNYNNYYEYRYYQPEFDFERQPELFDVQ